MASLTSMPVTRRMSANACKESVGWLTPVISIPIAALALLGVLPRIHEYT